MMGTDTTPTKTEVCPELLEELTAKAITYDNLITAGVNPCQLIAASLQETLNNV